MKTVLQRFCSTVLTLFLYSVGYGQYSSAGLFSNHDSSGQCGAASCTPAQQASLACPAAPLGFPTPSAVALAAGVPASVAGGQGCPAYTQSTATTYANYKLVWTPDWLAWMVNSVVMRNETLDVRNGFVPWCVHARAHSFCVNVCAHAFVPVINYAGDPSHFARCCAPTPARRLCSPESVQSACRAPA